MQGLLLLHFGQLCEKVSLFAFYTEHCGIQTNRKIVTVAYKFLQNKSRHNIIAQKAKHHKIGVDVVKKLQKIHFCNEKSFFRCMNSIVVDSVEFIFRAP